MVYIKYVSAWNWTKAGFHYRGWPHFFSRIRLDNEGLGTFLLRLYNQSLVTGVYSAAYQEV